MKQRTKPTTSEYGVPFLTPIQYSTSTQHLKPKREIYSLKGFTETLKRRQRKRHGTSKKYIIKLVMVERDHPVEALKLITSCHTVYDCKKPLRYGSRRVDSRYSQLGDSSNTNGISVPSLAISPFLSNSSSSSLNL